MAELLRQTEEEPVGDFVAMHDSRRVVLWDGEKVNAKAGHDFSHSTFATDVSSSVEFSADDEPDDTTAFADSAEADEDGTDDAAEEHSSGDAPDGGNADDIFDTGSAAEPDSYAPSHVPRQARAAFSRHYGMLTHHHVEDTMREVRHRARRRTMYDESLHLIDDLVNRPVDPMFEDAMLYKHDEKPAVRWAMRIVSFLLCVVIGIVCVVAVQSLHGNTREKVRKEEASQLADLVKQSDQLQSDVQALRKQLDDLSSDSSDAVKAPQSDGIANGTTAIEGPGLTVTLADPALPDDSTDTSSSSGRVSTGSGRKVADTDIQLFVDRLWAMGAEGISVNGQRLGPETSIRSAGGKILIGVTAIQSPYTIEAIGNADDLAVGVDADHNPVLHESLDSLGITVSITRSSKISLDGNAVTTLDYAAEYDGSD